MGGRARAAQAVKLIATQKVGEAMTIMTKEMEKHRKQIVIDDQAARAYAETRASGQKYDSTGDSPLDNAASRLCGRSAAYGTPAQQYMMYAQRTRRGSGVDRYAHICLHMLLRLAACPG